MIGFAVRCLTFADRLVEAERILSTAVDEARRHQANYRVGPLLAFRSEVALPRGRTARERRPTPRPRSRAYAHAGRLSVLGSTAMLVQALTERGELEAAQAALEAAGADGAPADIGDA